MYFDVSMIRLCGVKGKADGEESEDSRNEFAATTGQYLHFPRGFRNINIFSPSASFSVEHVASHTHCERRTWWRATVHSDRKITSTSWSKGNLSIATSLASKETEKHYDCHASDFERKNKTVSRTSITSFPSDTKSRTRIFSPSDSDTRMQRERTHPLTHSHITSLPSASWLPPPLLPSSSSLWKSRERSERPASDWFSTSDSSCFYEWCLWTKCSFPNVDQYLTGLFSWTIKSIACP